MSLTRQKIKANRPNEDPKIYPTWEAFVQAKVDRANEVISRIDQDKLREFIKPKKQSAPEKESSSESK